MEENNRRIPLIDEDEGRGAGIVVDFRLNGSESGFEG